VQYPDALAQLLQQLGWLRRRGGGWNRARPSVEF
jgi:hypothetical protein